MADASFLLSDEVLEDEVATQKTEEMDGRQITLANDDALQYLKMYLARIESICRMNAHFRKNVMRVMLLRRQLGPTLFAQYAPALCKSFLALVEQRLTGVRLAPLSTVHGAALRLHPVAAPFVAEYNWHQLLWAIVADAWEFFLAALSNGNEFYEYVCSEKTVCNHMDYAAPEFIETILANTPRTDARERKRIEISRKFEAIASLKRDYLSSGTRLFLPLRLTDLKSMQVTCAKKMWLILQIVGTFSIDAQRQYLAVSKIPAQTLVRSSNQSSSSIEAEDAAFDRTQQEKYNDILIAAGGAAANQSSSSSFASQFYIENKRPGSGLKKILDDADAKTNKVKAEIGLLQKKTLTAAAMLARQNKNIPYTTNAVKVVAKGSSGRSVLASRQASTGDSSEARARRNYSDGDADDDDDDDDDPKKPASNDDFSVVLAFDTEPELFAANQQQQFFFDAENDYNLLETIANDPINQSHNLPAPVSYDMQMDISNYDKPVNEFDDNIFDFLT